MTRVAITPPTLPPPVGPFSAAVRAVPSLYVSGQVAIDPATSKLVVGDVARQAEQIFANLEAVLAAAGKTFADVVRVGVYLTNMGDFAAMNAVYARHFAAPYPARTTIGVAALPLGAAIEIDLVAE
jgi:2-iminobutanoate/2-iminopropanoate deaminase